MRRSRTGTGSSGVLENQSLDWHQTGGAKVAGSVGMVGQKFPPHEREVSESLSGSGDQEQGCSESSLASSLPEQ